MSKILILTILIIMTDHEILLKQKTKIINFYKSQINTYDQIEKYSYWKFLYEEYQEWITKNFNTNATNIVELGCGTGLLTDIFFSNSLPNTVFILDLCKVFLKKAVDKHAGKNRIVPCNGDICNIPLKDQFADIVVCINVFDHIENFQDTLEEIKRISKKDTIFIFDITSSKTLDPWPMFGLYGKEGVKYFFKKIFNETVKYNWSIKTDDSKIKNIMTYRRSPKNVEKILENLGFNIINKKGMHLTSSIIPESIQVNSSSELLSYVNRICYKMDKSFNRISLLKNYSMFVLYACKLKK